MNDNSTVHSGRLEQDATNYEKINYSRWKRKVLSHVTLVRFLIIGFILLLIIFSYFLVSKIYKKYNAGLYLTSVANFLAPPLDQLASNNGRTNILVMGKAGGVHDGPDLTDTIMLVSASLNSPEVKIISIPRDLWIPEIRAKINSAYYWGKQKEIDSQSAGRAGLNFAKAEVSGVLNIPIQYGAVIDFSGFKDVIDELGGIDVDVANSFTDYYYPIAGKENDTCGGQDKDFMCRYETLHFDQGKQHMDGNTALKFVRSRHAEGIEGTDIAREARQGKVVDAIKNKLADKNTYKSPKKDMAILRVVLESVQTDLDYPTAAIIARRIFDSKESVSSYLIPEDLLVNPPVSGKYDFQSVFTPKLGNGRWEEIQKWVKDLL